MEHIPIQIMPTEAGRLKIVLPYHTDRVAKIKAIAGRYWTVPRTNETISHRLTRCAGEPEFTFGVTLDETRNSKSGTQVGACPGFSSGLTHLREVRKITTLCGMWSRQYPDQETHELCETQTYGDRLPPKIRELISERQKAGFTGPG